MALKAYTLDLALQTSSEFAIGNTIPNVAGIATDGKGFIPTKNSINKTITLSKGFGKFGGRLFELTEQTVYSWDAGSTDADAYLVIDLTKQNSFTGTIEDGTYTFVDNQSSIVVSSTQPEPSANTLVYKLDGNYNTMTGWLNAYIKDTRFASGITDFNLVKGKAWSGKWYKAGVHWSNEPTGASSYLQFEYTPADNDSSGILTIRDWTTNRHWIRTVSAGKWSNWIELANDSDVVHKAGNETIAGDKTFTGNIIQQTVTKTGSGNGITWTARKTGNDVYLTFQGTTLGSTSAGSYMSGFRVAEGMRPIDTAVNAIRVGSISFTVGALRNDGTLSVNSEVGSNIAIYGSFKYSVA